MEVAEMAMMLELLREHSLSGCIVIMPFSVKLLEVGYTVLPHDTLL